jgi:hypothetical protein
VTGKERSLSGKKLWRTFYQTHAGPTGFLSSLTLTTMAAIL